MAIPVISEISELMLLTKDVAMSAWKPFATDTPTGWACSGLPSGLSINSTTGVISGTPTATGSNSASLTATNGSGTSAPMAFVIKVIGSGLADEGMINLDIDLATGECRNAAMAVDKAQIYAKNDDIICFAIGFVRDGFLRALAPSKVTIAIRDTYEDEPVIVFDGVPGTPLDALAPRYRALCTLTAAGILAKLEEHSDDGSQQPPGTDWEMLAKCEITVEHAGTVVVSGDTARKRTTITFPFHLAKRISAPV